MIKKSMLYGMLLNFYFLFGQQELLIIKDFPSPDVEVVNFLQYDRIFNIGTFLGPIKHVEIKIDNYEEGNVASDSKINVAFDVNGNRVEARSLGHFYVLDELCNCDLDEGGDRGIYKTADTINYVIGKVKENLVAEPISVDEETGALELRPNQWFKDGVLVKQIEEDIMTKYVFDEKKKLTEKHFFIRDYLEDPEDQNAIYVSEFYMNGLVNVEYDEMGKLKKMSRYDYFQDEFYIHETSYGYNVKNQLVSYLSKEYSYYNIDVDETVALNEQSWFKTKEPITKSVEQSWIYENDKLIKASSISSNANAAYTQYYKYGNKSIVINESGKELEGDNLKEYKNRNEYRYDYHNNLVSFMSFNLESGEEKLIMDAKLKIEYY